MKGEEAGPLVVAAGGSGTAAPFGGVAPSTPCGVLAVYGGRGAAGGTAVSRGASICCAPAAPAVPVASAVPAVAWGAVCDRDGVPRPSHWARPSGAARAAAIVEEGENEEWME